MGGGLFSRQMMQAIVLPWFIFGLFLSLFLTKISNR
jgi:hypothetical protein